MPDCTAFSVEKVNMDETKENPGGETKGNKPLTQPQTIFCRYYCTTAKRNATQAYKMAYPKCKHGYRQCASRLLAKVNIQQEIARIDAKLREKVGHDYERAIKMLRSQYDLLQEKADNGNITAINARTSIIKELNEITGLHKQFVHTTSDGPAESQRELTSEDIAFLKEAATEYKQRIARSGEMPRQRPALRIIPGGQAS